MTLPVRMVALATASPPFTLAQSDAQATARELLKERFPNFDRMAPVFTTSGIRTRQLAQPLEWYLKAHDWSERGAAYLDGEPSISSSTRRAGPWPKPGSRGRPSTSSSPCRPPASPPPVSRRGP